MSAECLGTDFWFASTSSLVDPAVPKRADVDLIKAAHVILLFAVSLINPPKSTVLLNLQATTPAFEMARVRKPSAAQRGKSNKKPGDTSNKNKMRDSRYFETLHKPPTVKSRPKAVKAANAKQRRNLIKRARNSCDIIIGGYDDLPANYEARKGKKGAMFSANPPPDATEEERQKYNIQFNSALPCIYEVAILISSTELVEGINRTLVAKTEQGKGKGITRGQSGDW